MTTISAKFHVGQVVQHTLFGYRGVIVDVDSSFKGAQSWYDRMAKTKPPTDRPWYHVLVDDATYQTYVAERNLEPDAEGGPIKHPELEDYFNGLSDNGYVLRVKSN